MRNTLTLILLTFLSCVAHAQDGASKAFSEALLGIETLSGKFNQRITDNLGEEIQVTEGQFKVKRPGYFLWEIAPPYEQVVVGTPESLKVYDPDLEQMTVHSQDSLAGTPAALISGDVDVISNEYSVERKADKSGDTFVLEQKQAEERSFDSLVFVFKKKGKSNVLSAMTFIDKLGQKTEITISNLKTNKKIANTKFEFEPPKGTDIIIDG